MNKFLYILFSGILLINTPIFCSSNDKSITVPQHTKSPFSQNTHPNKPFVNVSNTVENVVFNVFLGAVNYKIIKDIGTNIRNFSSISKKRKASLILRIPFSLLLCTTHILTCIDPEILEYHKWIHKILYFF